MFVFQFLISITYLIGVLTGAEKPDEDIYLSCGYKGCPEISQNKTNVHLICHTHDDVGWVKTADEYFFGGRKRENYFAVEQILDSVVSELLKNKDRRFVYVESAFLWRWWLLKEDIVKDAFKKLVDEGRLQLAGGGWVMSDEATPHYSALIDQMTLGLRFMKDTFGECNLPKVAWQLDPFGHSGEVAIQFAEMGFDGLIFSRMDEREFEKRKADKSLEMIWKPDSREGSNAELFTGQTYDPMNPYHPPSGLCFDITCHDEPVIDNKMFHGYNIEKRANDFVSIVKEWSSVYNTNNVLLTMGGDFHYMVASSWFNNLDRLIKYINKTRKDMNVFYSTPACYVKALHSTKTNWPVKKDEDFFPYGGTASEIWTGYYTSRPSFKYLVHKANNFFQACKQMRVPLGTLFENEQDEMARAMATAQHHDAVSGTEKQFVAEDYIRYLSEGIGACERIVNETLRRWQDDKLLYNFCPKLNITECETSERNANFIVTLYNPQAQSKNYTVNIPVNLDTYVVSDSQGKEIPFDLLPVPNEVRAIPGRINYASHPHELIFLANNLPPLGIQSFIIERTTAQKSVKTKGVVDVTTFNIGDPTTQEHAVEFGTYKLLFSGDTGLLTKIIRENEEWKFEQNFLSYAAGYSGAYLFFTSGEAVPITNRVSSLSVAKGSNVVEIRQIFTAYLSQIIRIYKDKDQIEFQWLAGPFPKPMQLITRYTTALITGTFYTDSNGRRLMKRRKQDKIENSYYPITSAAVLKDDTHRVTILTDRAQGASSWQEGSIEIMVHRKLQTDDGKGVEEVLNELEFRGEGLVARGTHIVQLSTSSKDGNHTVFPDGAKRHRIGAQEIATAPIMIFSKTSHTTSKNIKSEISDSTKKPILKTTLPENVHLLTFERWTNNTVLLRLEHIFEIGEEPTLSKPATIKLKEMFADYEVTDAVELSLAATTEKTKMNRLRWKHNGKVQDEVKTEPLPRSLEITLQPMQIRTFEITMKTPGPPTTKSSASTEKFNIYLSIILLNFIALYFYII